MRLIKKNRDKSFHISYAPRFENMDHSKISEQLRMVGELHKTVAKLNANQNVLIADNGSSPFSTYLVYQIKNNALPLADNILEYFSFKNKQIRAKDDLKLLPGYNMYKGGQIIEIEEIRTLLRDIELETKIISSLLNQLQKEGELIEITPGMSMYEYGGRFSLTNFLNLLKIAGFAEVAYWKDSDYVSEDHLFVWHKSLNL